MSACSEPPVRRRICIRKDVKARAKARSEDRALKSEEKKLTQVTGKIIRDWPCVRCGSQDRGADGKCNPCKMVIARRSYQRHREDRIARVAEYKAKKRAKGRTRCVECRSLQKNDDGSCKKCTDKVKEIQLRIQIEKDRELRRIENQKLDRKWFKFLCKHDRYEKSVRISDTLNANYYFTYIEPKIVLLISEEIKSGTIKFDGYYRIGVNIRRSQSNGIYGIYQRTGNSDISRDFEKECWKNERRGESIRLDKIVSHAQEQERIRRENISREVKWILRKQFIRRQKILNGKKINKSIEEKSTKNFFQLLAAGQAISDYAKQQTKENQ